YVMISDFFHILLTELTALRCACRSFLLCLSVLPSSFFFLLITAFHTCGYPENQCTDPSAYNPGSINFHLLIITCPERLVQFQIAPSIIRKESPDSIHIKPDIQDLFRRQKFSRYLKFSCQKIDHHTPCSNHQYAFDSLSPLLLLQCPEFSDTDKQKDHAHRKQCNQP